MSVCMFVRPSVRMEQFGSHWTDFQEIWWFFENLSRKFRFHSNRTRIKSNLHEDRYTFVTKYCSFLLRKRNISDKRCRENQNTHFVTLFRKSCRLWGNVETTVERGTPQMTTRRMRIACWIPKATSTHSGCQRNTHCFSTATMVARKRLNVTIYVHCLSCCN